MAAATQQASRICSPKSPTRTTIPLKTTTQQRSACVSAGGSTRSRALAATERDVAASTAEGHGRQRSPSLSVARASFKEQMRAEDRSVKFSQGLIDKLHDLRECLVLNTIQPSDGRTSTCSTTTTMDGSGPNSGCSSPLQLSVQSDTRGGAVVCLSTVEPPPPPQWR